ncbi:PREDICTED: zinc finger protein 568-like isoform X2 [Polistes canadensis]|uniref:zinc finger protein 568-like isoform X2 n=1 Tax=Polistes canadensis TaxID=91411 RepID=UPI000718D87D|nr:PREDICTED: zinc finger protein 568-like isoform X2 [Polistes canadensis]
MNENMNAENLYLSYEINGNRFIIQTVSNSTDIIKSDEIPNDEQDGQIYAFQKEDVQELNLSHVDGQIELSDKTVLLSRDIENEETQFITNGAIIIENVDNDNQEHYEIVSEQNDKNLLMQKDDVNANDFVEVVTAFKCKICTYTTQDREELIEHFEKTHINPTVDVEEKEESANIDEVKLVYMCGECSNCFPSLEDCKEHMINDHQLINTAPEKAVKEYTTNELRYTNVEEIGNNCKNNPLIQQTKNNKSLNSKRTFNKKTIELAETNVRCTYRGCPYKFATEEIMQQHIAFHTESQSASAFKCNICRDLKFTKWRQCSLHLWKKHGIDVGLFTCNICKAYKSATMVKLLTHMKVHSETREYECSECGRCFKQASQLRNHRVMHLDRKTLEVKRWYTSKKCDMCGKTYANSKCLKNHIQAVHSKLRPYVCNVCGHSSARKAMLQMHLRQHTGDKPFSCELCEYKTGDHNTLRRHIMQHTGFRPYKCPHCSYAAIQSSSYKNHLKSRHPLLSGLFTCDSCSFKTVKKESYIQHIHNHEKGLIKSNIQKKGDENVEVFPGNIAAAQLIYSCLGAFSKVGDTLEANLMSSSTSADGTSQTITIQIPSKHLEGSLSSRENIKNSSAIEQEDEETMHCFLKLPREEEENIDTGGITIPAEPEISTFTTIDI